MDWATYLLYLKLQTIQFCRSLLITTPDCKEEVIDCVMDGEQLSWCKQAYMEEVTRRMSYVEEAKKN